MKRPTNEPHDFMVEKVEAHPASSEDVTVLLTDVRGGRVRLHMSKETAGELSGILTGAAGAAATGK